MTLKPALPQWRMGWDSWSDMNRHALRDDALVVSAAFKAGVAFADYLHEVRFQTRAVDLLNDAEIENLSKVTLKCECHGH